MWIEEAALQLESMEQLITCKGSFSWESESSRGLEAIPATRQDCWEAVQRKAVENGPEEEGGGSMASCVYLDFLSLCVDWQRRNLVSLTGHVHPPPAAAQGGHTCVQSQGQQSHEIWGTFSPWISE